MNTVTLDERSQLIYFMGVSMKEELLEYLDLHFPNLYSEIHIRFELGDPFPNGSDDRIEQVKRRVTTVFEELFMPDDYLYLYIKDWENINDPMFGNTTPKYIYELLHGRDTEEEILFEVVEDEDDKGNKI